MTRIASLLSLVAALVATPMAAAHVTLNPNEWEAGGFARFALRVPTERPDASTTEVTLQFPESVISASFQPVPGWERTVEMATLDEPVEVFGEQVTERIASVTWSGGEIAPGEFQEFGISFQVPEGAAGQDLTFPAIQTYSSGEVVRWIGPPDADTPAPAVTAVPPAEEEGEETAARAEEAEETAVPAAGEREDDDDGTPTLALVFGIAGLAAGLGALGLVLVRGRRPL